MSQIFEYLNDQQREAVEKTDGPLLVLSGAGSGKTRTIVHRIAWLIENKNVPPNRIVAVTFTNKAAQEMRERAHELVGESASRVVIRTFHSLGLHLLRQYANALSYPPNFSIWDDSDQRQTIEIILNEEFSSQKSFNKTHIRYFYQTISSFKDQLISPDEVADKADLDEYEFGDLLEDVYRIYEERKKLSQAMDFADLIYQTVTLLQRDEAILADLHRKFRYFLVDEYQDTNHAQYMLVQLLAAKDKNLCVVGDDDQSIYGWRGADVNNILDFREDFPDALVTKLEENYRSTQSILDIANHVIRNNHSRMEKTLFTSISGGEKPQLSVYSDDRSEAKEVALAVSEELKKTSPSSIAVLYRTNAMSRQFEEAFLAENIPYRIYGGTAFFARREIKDAMAYLQFLVNPQDEIAFLRIINTPSRGLGEKSVEKLVEHYRKEQEIPDLLELMNYAEGAGLARKASSGLEELYEWMSAMQEKANSASDFALLFEDMLSKSGLYSMYEEEDRLLGSKRLDSLSELKNSMILFQNENPEGTLGDYLQNVSLFSSTQEMEGDNNSVALMTVHNAKGLEFDTVFLTGLEENIFPHYLSQTEGSVEEERRLFYVAVTRARKRLFLSRAARRMTFGRYQNMDESRFLEEVEDSLLEVREFTAPPVSSFPTRSFPGTAKKKSTSPFRNTVGIPSGPPPDLKRGDEVEHQNFGRGKVLNIEGSGDSAKIHIYFNDGKTRKFILRFTKLKKL